MEVHYFKERYTFNLGSFVIRLPCENQVSCRPKLMISKSLKYKMNSVYEVINTEVLIYCSLINLSPSNPFTAEWIIFEHSTEPLIFVDKLLINIWSYGEESNVISKFSVYNLFSRCLWR